MMILGALCQKSKTIKESTKILMPFTTTSGFLDVANNHSITLVGSPTISTTQSKFGAGALRMAAGKKIRINSTPTLNVGGKKIMTIECWVYLESATGGFLSMRDTANYCPFIFQQPYILIGDSSLNGWSFRGTSMTLAKWTHVAMVLDGNLVKMYYDGVHIDTDILEPNWPSNNRFLDIGADFGGQATGYLNDLRISNAAVYTANFTPPSQPLVD